MKHLAEPSTLQQTNFNQSATDKKKKKKQTAKSLNFCNDLKFFCYPNDWNGTLNHAGLELTLFLPAMGGISTYMSVT